MQAETFRNDEEEPPTPLVAGAGAVAVALVVVAMVVVAGNLGGDFLPPPDAPPATLAPTPAPTPPFPVATGFPIPIAPPSATAHDAFPAVPLVGAAVEAVGDTVAPGGECVDSSRRRRLFPAEATEDVGLEEVLLFIIGSVRGELLTEDLGVA